MVKKIFLVSRCSWTLYNFRAGLMRTLKEEGNIVVGGGASDDGFMSKIELLGIPFKTLPVDKKGINPQADIKLFITLYNWYRKERPDIVHHFTIKPVIYGSLAARLAGIPRIINTVTGLGYIFTSEDKKGLKSIVERLYQAAFNAAHLTFFLNQDDFDFFYKKQLIKNTKYWLLPGEGIDCIHFSPNSNIANQTRENEKIIFLMSSRLLRDKGVYEFVEAAREVKIFFPETKFLLLGKRDERNPSVILENELNQWKKENVVDWLGEVSDVRPIISKSDIVVLPSYREGLPRSLLEAAAMEKPLITTDVIGCRNVIEDGITGILVPVKNSQALAKAMKKMIENPVLRLEMGKAGRKKVIKEFEEKNVISTILSKYEMN